MDWEEKTISSTPIFSGRIVRLRVDQVSLPDGRQSQREIVEHPGAVAILPLDVDNMIWMVSQYRKAVEQVLLEIPAGTLEENEDPLDCAKRELAEETVLMRSGEIPAVHYFIMLQILLLNSRGSSRGNPSIIRA